MILNTETLAHISSYSAGSGQIDLELEDESLELADKVSKVGASAIVVKETFRPIIFLAKYCDSLVIIAGKVLSYEKVEPDPDVPEQDVFARVSFIDATSVSITWPEDI